MSELKGRRDFLKLAGLGGVVFASGLAGACSKILRKSGAREDDFAVGQMVYVAPVESVRVKSTATRGYGAGASRPRSRPCVGAIGGASSFAGATRSD